jgi:hypothetical protein
MFEHAMSLNFSQEAKEIFVGKIPAKILIAKIAQPATRHPTRVSDIAVTPRVGGND